MCVYATRGSSTCMEGREQGPCRMNSSRIAFLVLLQHVSKAVRPPRKGGPPLMHLLRRYLLTLLSSRAPLSLASIWSAVDFQWYVSVIHWCSHPLCMLVVYAGCLVCWAAQ
jgi:hypothetical protein